MGEIEDALSWEVATLWATVRSLSEAKRLQLPREERIAMGAEHGDMVCTRSPYSCSLEYLCDSDSIVVTPLMTLVPEALLVLLDSLRQGCG